MGLFERKFDVKEDKLRIVFNPTEKIYDVYYGNTLIPYNKLNRKSKKYIENENNNLLTNPDKLAMELERTAKMRRFDKLKSLGYSCDSFEYLGSVEGTLSKQMEELLNKLVKEENVLLGIHRIGSNDSPEKIADILNNGLEITGHMGGGVLNKRELKNNVGYYPDNKTIIKELMYADCYKNSKGSILIRIPDSDLTQNIFIIDKNGKTRLNPKYIVGYVPLFKEHHLETIVTPDGVRNVESKPEYSYPFENQFYQKEMESDSQIKR